MTIFEARPKPNHSAKSGAMAKTGSAWLTTITGRRMRRVGGRKLIANARSTPQSVPAAKPITVSVSVVTACTRQSSGWATSAAKTRAGSGSMKGGGANTKTIPCQMTRSPSPTNNARSAIIDRPFPLCCSPMPA